MLQQPQGEKINRDNPYKIRNTLCKTFYKLQPFKYCILVYDATLVKDETMIQLDKQKNHQAVKPKTILGNMWIINE